MEILKELSQSERNTLKEKHRDHHLFPTHIATVLDKRHCFVVSIWADDYSRILIHSGLPIAEDPPYSTLSSAIVYIQRHQDFLETTSEGCLNGQRVKHYVALLEKCEAISSISFVELGDCFMLDKSQSLDRFRNEITDGMHRLVAYGLATERNEEYFPIPVYFGTDKTVLPLN